MDRWLDACEAEGEIALTIGYDAGRSPALEILGGAMQMIASLDALDRALLSSVHTELEPVSILNDVQHSSLKILLKRWLRGAPDEMLASGDWKRWVGTLLVKGKHMLLAHMDDDAPAIAQTLETLRPDYESAPGLVGYDPPPVEKAAAALEEVRIARRLLAGSSVIFQSDFEETVGYDAAQNEVDRRLTIVRVHGVKSPPTQGTLLS